MKFFYVGSKIGLVNVVIGEIIFYVVSKISVVSVDIGEIILM